MLKHTWLTVFNSLFPQQQKFLFKQSGWQVCSFLCNGLVLNPKVPMFDKFDISTIFLDMKPWNPQMCLKSSTVLGANLSSTSISSIRKKNYVKTFQDFETLKDFNWLISMGKKLCEQYICFSFKTNFISKDIWMFFSTQILSRQTHVSVWQKETNVCHSRRYGNFY